MRRAMFLGLLMAGLVLTASTTPVIAAEIRKPALPTEQGESDFLNSSPFMDLSPETRATLMALFKEHRDKVYPLREQLWAKQTALFALRDNPKTEPQQIKALVDEMSSLRVKLHAERLAFEEKVIKDTGIDAPFGFHGMGRGWHGRGGYGMGRGWHGRGGYGMGRGWHGQGGYDGCAMDYYR